MNAIRDGNQIRVYDAYLFKESIKEIDGRFYDKDDRSWVVPFSKENIDFTTGMMCYIQLSLLGCAGFVKIGNTITDPMTTNDDHSKYWYTPYYFSDVWHYRRVFHNIDLLFRRNEE